MLLAPSSLGSHRDGGPGIPSDPCGPHRLVSEGWQDNGLLHGVHDQLPQLLQYPLQHRLLADFGKESQAGGEG